MDDICDDDELHLILLASSQEMEIEKQTSMCCRLSLQRFLMLSRSILGRIAFVNTDVNDTEKIVEAADEYLRSLSKPHDFAQLLEWYYDAPSEFKAKGTKITPHVQHVSLQFFLFLLLQSFLLVFLIVVVFLYSSGKRWG